MFCLAEETIAAAIFTQLFGEELHFKIAPDAEYSSLQFSVSTLEGNHGQSTPCGGMENNHGHSSWACEAILTNLFMANDKESVLSLNHIWEAFTTKVVFNLHPFFLSTCYQSLQHYKLLLAKPAVALWLSVPKPS